MPPEPEPETRGSPPRPPEGAGPASPEGDAEASEIALPLDAFEEFRFPAEQDVEPVDRKSGGRGFGILGWIGLSLAIILLFALVVNLVLPGIPE